MRILITGRGFDAADTHQLGVFELDQAKALRSAGHDVRFAAVDTRSILRRRPLGCRAYTLDGVDIFYCATPAGARPASLAEAAQRSAARAIWRRVTADGWRPEIIHSHFGAGFLPLAREVGIPAVFTEHSSAANRDELPPAELRREQRTYALAGRVLCVSSALARRIEAHTGVAPTVVPNIVDTGVFRPSAYERSARESFRFVTAGNLLPVKGMDLLLEATAQLRDRGEGVSLTVIGDGPEEKSLRALAERLELTGAVRFTGRLTRPEMAELYKDQDAFVLASRAETFGVVLIEALAAGLPVVATRCGGPEDFVDASNGVLAAPGDADALAAAMEQMIAKRPAYDGAAISAAARERFSPEAVALKLLQVYADVLTATPREGE